MEYLVKTWLHKTTHLIRDLHSSQKREIKLKMMIKSVAPRPQAFYHRFQLEMGPGKPNQAKNSHKMRGA